MNKLIKIMINNFAFIKEEKVIRKEASDFHWDVLNKFLEEMIEKNPEQWIWSHDRWK